MLTVRLRRQNLRLWFVGAIAVASCLFVLRAPEALAHHDHSKSEGPFEYYCWWCPWPREVIFINPGITLGGTHTVGGDGSGFTLGGEVSALYWWDKVKYVGGVVDTVYDFARNGGRSMLGPMVGFGPVGIDGGYLLEYGDAGTAHGGAVRFFVSGAVLGVFVRYGALAQRPNFVEVGVLLKLPLKFKKYCWPCDKWVD